MLLQIPRHKMKIKQTPLYRFVVDLLYRLVINPINLNRLNRKTKIVRNHAGARDVFEVIYKENLWNSEESISGTGSTFSNTVQIRERLSGFIKERQIKSILDVPCGDFNWMKHVDLSDVKYIGADIVREIIVKNKIYETSSKKFITLDLLKDELPKTDLILVRDCFVHLSISEIQEAIANILKSEITFLLTTTFCNLQVNKDISTGLWRPINLERNPFNFPSPLETIDDSGTGKFNDKRLGLWNISNLRKP